RRAAEHTPLPDLTADPGSFRDPSSRVFRIGGRILRALSADADADFRAVRATPFFRAAIEQRRLVPTEEAAAGPAELGLGDEWVAVLEHPVRPVWSYPYEWSFSMLRDAALLQLDLLAVALEHDLSCKDATPFNIQFDGV